MNFRPFVADDAPTVAVLIAAEEDRFYGRNPTGAVALYARVGMQIESCGVAFEKVTE